MQRLTIRNLDNSISVEEVSQQELLQHLAACEDQIEKYEKTSRGWKHWKGNTSTILGEISLQCTRGSILPPTNVWNLCEVLRMEDRCVCCGEIIPEGRHVCSKCYREKFFPVAGSKQKCQPKGMCFICGQPFFEVEPVGWVKPLGRRSKRYYHARCFMNSK